MRLIDADELKGKAFADPDDGEYFVYCQDIDEAPTVDAVPAVKCWDCEHLVNATVNANGFLICGVSDMEVASEDFCSHGERKVDKNGRT